MRPSIDGNGGRGGPLLFDRTGLIALLDRLYPRLITQIDRDPDSPTYGSADRQFWMYRLHDFDSGVLQQAGLTLACLVALAQSEDLTACRHLKAEHVPYWRDLARAINQRTVQRLAGRGRLDEYYPGEQSLPGTVFACYAVLKSALMLGQDEIVRSAGLEHAANDMITLRASRAANQDTAAAAFLALYSRARNWRRTEVETTVDQLIGHGRFEEYGGLDVGYATVTLNYLGAMLDDESHPTRPAVCSLATLLAEFIGPGGNLGGEFASRSTTYFLPFGFVVAAAADSHLAPALAPLDVGTVYEKLDDRYLMHYCFPSLAMAALKLSRVQVAVTPRSASADWRREHHRSLGIYSCRNDEVAAFIGLDKGGVVQIDSLAGSEIDAGYRLRRGTAVYASAVLERGAPCSVEETETTMTIRIRTPFRRYRPLVAGPMKTVMLRLLWFAGRRFNEYFKKRLIAHAEELSGPLLDRTIHIDLEHRVLEIDDQLVGLAPGDTVTPAPPSSLRLVPSARFHQPGEEAAATARLQAEAIDETRRRRFPLTGTAT